jgi:hypothetical protein
MSNFEKLPKGSESLIQGIKEFLGRIFPSLVMGGVEQRFFMDDGGQRFVIDNRFKNHPYLSSTLSLLADKLFDKIVDCELSKDRSVQNVYMVGGCFNKMIRFKPENNNGLKEIEISAPPDYLIQLNKLTYNALPSEIQQRSMDKKIKLAHLTAVEAGNSPLASDNPMSIQAVTIKSMIDSMGDNKEITNNLTLGDSAYTIKMTKIFNTVNTNSPLVSLTEYRRTRNNSSFNYKIEISPNY